MPSLDLFAPLTPTLASLDAMLTLGQTGAAGGSGKSPEFLLSLYAPLVLLIAFLPWAWVVSKVYDKHAAQFFLPRRTWNVAHMSAGVLALLAMLVIGSF